MGYRSRRRGGGHHRGHFTGEANGLQPGDDVGNRRSFKQIQHPPEDIGNRRESDESLYVPHDDIGNRVDAAPTHELSGVLMELDGKRRRKRSIKGNAPVERIGRYFVGGVNPLVAGGNVRPPPQPAPQQPAPRSDDAKHLENGFDEEAAVDAVDAQPQGEGQGGGRKKRRRGGREQVDGFAAQEVNERRAQRFFDFEEDDRFEYQLKSDPDAKRQESEDAVRNIVVSSGRDAIVRSRVIEDGDKPKVLVTIEDKGPAADLPPERRPEGADEPLFVLGNAALMSLNYLVNKIVNRYPDDRIRLAVLPASDEGLYLESLAEHRRAKNGVSVPSSVLARPTPSAAPPAPAPAPVSVDDVVPESAARAEPALVAEETAADEPIAAAPEAEPDVEAAEDVDEEPAAAAADVEDEEAPAQAADEDVDEEKPAPRRAAKARATKKASAEEKAPAKKAAKATATRATKATTARAPARRTSKAEAEPARRAPSKRKVAGDGEG